VVSEEKIFLKVYRRTTDELYLKLNDVKNEVTLGKNNYLITE
jgi:hypothetical protein